MSPSGDLVADAQAGRRLSYPGGPPDDELAERMLELPTALIREAGERNPAVAELDLDAELERLDHEWLPYRGELIHLEAHRVDDSAPSFVVVPGLGDHARRHLALATALAARGFNSLLVDRSGHGISEGRRGDAPLETDLGVLELAIGHARRGASGPVVLLGDSLGGIMAWYLLTREPDVEAAVCHCIGHPEVHHDPSFRFKAPLMRALGRVAPFTRIPVRQIADYEQVALDPVTKRYFTDEVDKLFNFHVTARSAASYLGFRPGIEWRRVQTPALVLIGGADAMVTPEFTRRALERDRPPRAEFVEIEGAGHQLFLDDLGATIDPVVAWVQAALAQEGDKAPVLG
jgi:alpha-beta hydrolase superfamily lysophospholipase